MALSIIFWTIYLLNVALNCIIFPNICRIHSQLIAGIPVGTMCDPLVVD